MKSKFLLATLLIGFSAQSFATGTIECLGKDAFTLKGKKVTMSVLVNTGYDANSGLASDFTISQDVSKKKYNSLSKNEVTFKSNEKELLILKADETGASTDILFIKYDTQKQSGSMILKLNGKLQISTDVTCNFDY